MSQTTGTLDWKYFTVRTVLNYVLCSSDTLCFNCSIQFLLYCKMKVAVIHVLLLQITGRLNSVLVSAGVSLDLVQLSHNLVLPARQPA